MKHIAIPLVLCLCACVGTPTPFDRPFTTVEILTFDYIDPDTRSIRVRGKPVPFDSNYGDDGF